MDYAEPALMMAPRAARNMKEALYRGYHIDPLKGQAFGNAIGQNLIGMRDSIEGPTAFSEKLQARFTDT